MLCGSVCQDATSWRVDVMGEGGDVSRSDLCGYYEMSRGIAGLYLWIQWRGRGGEDQGLISARGEPKD